ncbi:MAG TPA: RagB/SusD family nutrient uptake outer membrane protein [Puia sp.]|jgi:hypothetical protein|nr:RagB/SusD family nutrient uptake outer membrane protein [Puia sp.]
MKKFSLSQNIKWLAALPFLAALAFLAVTLTSCTKLLRIPPNPSNEIPSSSVFADSSDIMSAVAGIYTNFGLAEQSGTLLDGLVTICTGLTGDELVPAPTNQPGDLQFYENAIRNTNTNDDFLWSSGYSSLYQINVCLSGIAGSTAISSALQQQLTGELEVDRALCYFHLVNLFGPVPLVTTADYHVSESLPRASVAQIYAQVITDLTSAQQLLTAAYPSAGTARPNLYVADALLAKVYLYTGQWQNAENAASSVISSGSYSLNTDLNTVFLDGSNEAIWQLPANSAYTQTYEAALFIPYVNTVPSYSLDTGLLNAFEAGDQRLQDWTAIDTVNVNGSNMTYYYPFKYKNTLASATPVEDYMIFRLAELYLIRAEAEAEIGGNQLASAIADLNLIRQRAGLLPYAGVANPASVLAAIAHERQVELFCEWGNRWYDLNRTGTINTVLGAEKAGWTATDSLYPIPLPELQRNPFLTQNAGY